MAQSATATRRVARKAGKTRGSGRRKPLVIDIHNHIAIPLVAEYAASPGTGGRSGGKRSWVSGRSAELHERRVKSIRAKQTNPKVRLRDMDKAGIDIQIISFNMPSVGYLAGAKKGAELARAVNDGVAEFCAAAPDRFVGIGSVPLQDMKRAIRELEYAVNDLHLKGVSILTNIAGRDLGDKRFRPFWRRVAELDCAVLIHPQGFTQPERLSKFHMWNTIGQPLEEAICMSSLIYEGVMEEFPKLKISMAHGGGYLPFYPGRGDRNHIVSPEPREFVEKPPSYYFRRFHYDTVVFDKTMIETLARTVGAGQVMLGTDYPWQLWDPVSMVKRSRGLSGSAKERILWRNAARFFSLRL